MTCILQFILLAPIWKCWAVIFLTFRGHGMRRENPGAFWALGYYRHKSDIFTRAPHPFPRRSCLPFGGSHQPNGWVHYSFCNQRYCTTRQLSCALPPRRHRSILFLHQHAHLIYVPIHPYVILTHLLYSIARMCSCSWGGPTKVLSPCRGNNSVNRAHDLLFNHTCIYVYVILVFTSDNIGCITSGIESTCCFLKDMVSASENGWFLQTLTSLSSCTSKIEYCNVEPSWLVIMRLRESSRPQRYVLWRYLYHGVTSVSCSSSPLCVCMCVQADVKKARIPIANRDYCVDVLIPLNECRRKNYYLPWKCEEERHAYELCQYKEYKLRTQK